MTDTSTHTRWRIGAPTAPAAPGGSRPAAAWQDLAPRAGITLLEPVGSGCIDRLEIAIELAPLDPQALAGCCGAGGATAQDRTGTFTLPRACLALELRLELSPTPPIHEAGPRPRAVDVAVPLPALGGLPGGFVRSEGPQVHLGFSALAGRALPFASGARIGLFNHGAAPLHVQAMAEGRTLPLPANTPFLRAQVAQRVDPTASKLAAPREIDLFETHGRGALLAIVALDLAFPPDSTRPLNGGTAPLGAPTFTSALGSAWDRSPDRLLALSSHPTLESNLDRSLVPPPDEHPWRAWQFVRYVDGDEHRPQFDTQPAADLFATPDPGAPDPGAPDAGAPPADAPRGETPPDPAPASAPAAATAGAWSPFHEYIKCTLAPIPGATRTSDAREDSRLEPPAAATLPARQLVTFAWVEDRPIA
ncbi:MAG: hypothetical protein ACREJ2_00290 [Planctomycetota bacterium]